MSYLRCLELNDVHNIVIITKGLHLKVICIYIWLSYSGRGGRLCFAVISLLCFRHVTILNSCFTYKNYIQVYGYVSILSNRLNGQCPLPGSIIVGRSPGMREVVGSIPGRAEQKTLKCEVLLLCLALSSNELETDWVARRQDNGLSWDITAFSWRVVSVASTIKTGRRSD